MRRAIFQLLLWSCCVAPATLGASNSVIVWRGGMPPPAPTTRAFVSKNGKFRAVVEELVDPTGVSFRMSPIVILSMTTREENKTNALWRKTYQSIPVAGWRDYQVFVSDDGTFCVIPIENRGAAVLKEKSVYRIFPGPEPFRRWEGFFNSPDQRLYDFDWLRGEPIVRVWDRDADRWAAYSIRDEKEITVTPELTTLWNDAARKKVLDELARAQTEEIRKRLDSVSSKLTELTKAASGFIKAGDLREIHYQFLAVRRNPTDRPWLDRLLRAAPSSPLAAPWPAGYAGIARLNYNFAAGPADPYSFTEINAAHMAADTLLAVYDGKITNKTAYGARPAGFHYLGRVAGVVRFPAPLIKRDGQIRIVLVPEANIKKEWWLDGFNAIEAAIIPTSRDQADLTDDISFDFGAVAPGRLFAKAIWDKRPPFTDLHSAGPGDYDSGWVGPIDLKASSAVTNLFLWCTNSAAAGGENYYAADRVVARQWKDSGELTMHKAILGPDGNEIFSAPASKWIVATNFKAPGVAFELTRLAMISFRAAKSPPANNYSDTRPLTVAWRRGIRPDRSMARDPAFLRILDEHDCPFAPTQTNGSSRLGFAIFRKFPRSAKTWRLVGYGPGGKSEMLFDYTITNRVRTEPLQLVARPLPLELDLGPVKMIVEKVVGDGPNAWMESSFIENGVKSSSWRIGSLTSPGGFHFSDADDNEIDPAEMCREQKVNRVFGYVAENVPVPKKAFPFEFVIERVKPFAPREPLGKN
jgi:hypothetical protein